MAAFAWGVFLLTLTSWPSPPEVPLAAGIPNFDKIVHFGLYAVAGFLLYLAVRWPGREGFSLARVLAIVGTMAALGTVDEVHQTWIPGRSCDPADALFDSIGACAGAIAASAASGRARPGRNAAPAARA
ncbi:MAG: VanZ family protein [Acidobacteriota bacterium]